MFVQSSLGQTTTTVREFRAVMNSEVNLINKFISDFLTSNNTIIVREVVSKIQQNGQLSQKYQDFIIGAINYTDYLANECKLSGDSVKSKLGSYIERWIAYIVVNFSNLFNLSLSQNEIVNIQGYANEFVNIVQVLANSNVMRMLQQERAGNTGTGGVFGITTLSSNANSFQSNNNTLGSSSGVFASQSSGTNIFNRNVSSNLVIPTELSSDIQSSQTTQVVQQTSKVEEPVVIKEVKKMRKQFDIEGRKDVIASTIKEAFIMNYDDHALFPVFKPIGLFKEQTFNKEKFLKLTERIPVDIQDKLSKVSPTIVKIEDFELSEDVNSILVGLGENIAEEVVNTVKGPCLGNIARSSGILIEKESVDIIYQDFSSLVSVTHDDCLDFLKKLNAYSTLFNFDSLYKYLNAHLLRFINLSLDTPLVEFDYANDAKELTAYYNKQVETSDSDLSEKFKRCAVIWDTIIPTMIRDYFLHKEEVMVTTEEGEKEVNSIDTLINFLYVDFPASKLPIGTATKPGKFSYVRKTNSPVLYNFFDKVYVNTKFRTLIICSDYTVIEVLSDLINRDTYYFGVVSE